MVEPAINRQYTRDNITELYKTKTGEMYKNEARVVGKWSGRGKTYVTIELASGDRWKLAQRFTRPEGPPIYSAAKIEEK